MDSLISSGTIVRVSSVLNRDVKHYGKSFMFDGDEETCWNSDQGSPQFVQLEFPIQVLPQRIILKFQGGFVGKDCSIKTLNDAGEWMNLTDLYPKDISSEQMFDMVSSDFISKLRICFNSSSDFFGRITIYKLDVLGLTKIT